MTVVIAKIRNTVHTAGILSYLNDQVCAIIIAHHKLETSDLGLIIKVRQSVNN